MRTGRMVANRLSALTARASVAPPRARLLRRKCACGGSASALTGKCEECEKKKVGGTTLQGKLLVNRPGDVYEQEADRVAEAVMRMQEPAGRIAEPVQANPPLVWRGVSEGGGLTEAPPIVHDVLSSPGQPLDAASRAFFEPRFGHNFANVRVHTDLQAAQSARAVNATAYTVGRDIVFGAGNFASGTREGRQVIAHELAHTVQNHDCPNPGLTGQRLSRQESDTEAPSLDFEPTYNLSLAEQEVEQPPNGAFFNGVVLTVRRNGQLVAQGSAYSGARGTEDWQKSMGPIPDGKHYFMMPHITKPPIKEYQIGGIVGARGIDSGYQEIIDSSVHGTWGKQRIAIEPSTTCVPVPPGEKSNCGLAGGKQGIFRSGFYLHGGDPGRAVTSGCIKVADSRIFEQLRKFGARIPLWVKKYRGSPGP